MTAKKDDTLYVGIDLGTSQSSITASNGQRHVVKSLVGWPLDMVSRKILKRDVLIGQEALDNRPMLELHRPLERGLIKEGSEKDLAAVRELLQHLLSLVGVNGKRENGQRVRAVVGVPAEAMRITAQDLHLLGVIDGIIPEPLGGAHRDPVAAIASLKSAVVEELSGCLTLGREELIKQRRAKFLAIG